MLITFLVGPSVQLLMTNPTVLAVKEQLMARFRGRKTDDHLANADAEEDNNIREKAVGICDAVQGIVSFEFSLHQLFFTVLCPQTVRMCTNSTLHLPM